MGRENQQTVGQLQLELANEGIKVYYEKLEALCFQLIEALLLENTKKAEETVINKMIKKQALPVFVAVLMEPYHVLVKSQNKNTLREAYQAALEAEKTMHRNIIGNYL
ncbi:Hypothetical protein CINCED_3A023226 [Cinara cedri]|uniref:Uncharacterized protein n=1 Tax=Cinara cedri TaxID=506608 RepID=A0A5E4MXP9_9HEMI|nr:Hypothetical protein CINCED_3A023226 [Cinara cedri]